MTELPRPPGDQPESQDPTLPSYPPPAASPPSYPPAGSDPLGAPFGDAPPPPPGESPPGGPPPHPPGPPGGQAPYQQVPPGAAPPPPPGGGQYAAPPGGYQTSGSYPPGGAPIGGSVYGAGGAPASGEERTWVLVAHFGGALAQLLTGGALGWLVPLVARMANANLSPNARAQVTDALNFQLTWTIATVASWVLVLCSFGLLFFLPFVPVVIAVVFGIVAGIKANQGGAYRYPMTIRMVK